MYKSNTSTLALCYNFISFMTQFLHFKILLMENSFDKKNGVTAWHVWYMYVNFKDKSEEKMDFNGRLDYLSWIKQNIYVLIFVIKSCGWKRIIQPSNYFIKREEALLKADFKVMSKDTS